MQIDFLLYPSLTRSKGMELMNTFAKTTLTQQSDALIEK